MHDVNLQEWKTKIERDGYLIIKNYLSKPDICCAKNDIDRYIELDLNERNNDGSMFGRYEGSAGVTHNNQGRHIITDFFGRSEILENEVANFFSDVNVKGLLEHIGGKHLKLRGFNSRKLSGIKDYSAMEWHRDNYGEITVAIIMDSSNISNDGATCVIPGSHIYPCCPFKDLNFEQPFPIPKMPIWQRFFSSILERRVAKSAVDIVGEVGDVYIFLGDLWHGRRVNLVNNNGMVFFIGLFPSEIPFPQHSKVNIPESSVLDRLPLELRKLVDYINTPPNDTKNSYFYKMKESTRRMKFFSLINIAYLEKKFWNLLLGGLR